VGQKLVTVHDVAARSGVSIATVSRTLRQPHRVSEDTRDRVLAAVRELDYHPNRAASSLRRGRTGVIALVVPDIENPYFASLTKGAQAIARARGYGLVVVDTTEQADVEAEEIAALTSQIDGIIIASSRLPDARLTESIAGLRAVLINRDPAPEGPTAPTVTIDERAGAAAAVEHLCGLGHRELAYVGGPRRSWSEGRRAEGLRAAVAAFPGVALREIGHYSPDARGGRQAAPDALAAGTTAVIAYNDLVALGLLAAWSERRVRVPEDVSLVGFDNTYVAELSSPRLTSVGADLRAFGREAVDLLIAQIDPVADVAEEPRRELEPTLVVRDSTALRRDR
jgi:DNA-binding LacI/PurR family transcriptional regulator